jgi:hypothetical protein
VPSTPPLFSRGRVPPARTPPLPQALPLSDRKRRFAAFVAVVAACRGVKEPYVP